MLASDLNNPEFQGAIPNPDQLLFVQFYWHEPIDKWKTREASEKAGKYVEVKGPRQIFVRIMQPGNQTSMMEVPLRESHKQRWPDRWLAWQISEGMIDGGENMPGWKVEEWKELNESQVRELKYLRFHTVEMIAGATDAQVQKLGMGGLGMREKAKQALREKLSADLRQQDAAKDKEIADLRAKMEEMEKKFSALTAPPPQEDWESRPVLPPANYKRRGRPPKPPEPVNG